MTELQFELKELKVLVKELNDLKLGAKIAVIGKKKQEIAENFMLTVEGVPEKKENTLSKKVVEYYNMLSEQSTDSTTEPVDGEAPSTSKEDDQNSNTEPETTTKLVEECPVFKKGFDEENSDCVICKKDFTEDYETCKEVCLAKIKPKSRKRTTPTPKATEATSKTTETKPKTKKTKIDKGPVIAFLTKEIEKAKHQQKELIALADAKFDNISKKVITDIISYGKNPKYCKFAKVIGAVKKTGELKFTKTNPIKK